MPFKSKRMMRWMFANHPRMARRWAKHTRNLRNLPETAEKKGSRLPAELCQAADALSAPAGLAEKLAALTAPTAAQVNSLQAMAQAQATARPAVGPALQQAIRPVQPAAQRVGELPGRPPLFSPKGAVPQAMQRGGVFRQPSGPGIAALGVGNLMSKYSAALLKSARLRGYSLGVLATGAEAEDKHPDEPATLASSADPLEAALSPEDPADLLMWRRRQAALQRLRARRKTAAWSVDVPGADQAVEQTLGDAAKALGYRARVGARGLSLGAGTLYGAGGGLAVGGSLGGLLSALLAEQLTLNPTARAGLLGLGVGAGGMGGALLGGRQGYKLIDRVLKRRAAKAEEEEAMPTKQADEYQLPTGEYLPLPTTPYGMPLPGDASRGVVRDFAGDLWSQIAQGAREQFNNLAPIRGMRGVGGLFGRLLGGVQNLYTSPRSWMGRGVNPFRLSPERRIAMQAEREMMKQPQWDNPALVSQAQKRWPGRPATPALPTAQTGLPTAQTGLPQPKSPFTIDISTGKSNYTSPFIPNPRTQLGRPAVGGRRVAPDGTVKPVSPPT